MVVIVHNGSALNTAVKAQFVAFCVSPTKLKLVGLVKGALNTCGVPEQPVIVKVPVVGALLKYTEPETSYIAVGVL